MITDSRPFLRRCVACSLRCVVSYPLIPEGSGVFPHA